VPAEGDNAVSAVSELEVREWLGEQGAGAEELGREEPPLVPPTPDFMASVGEGKIRFPFVVSLCLFFCNSLGAYHIILGQAWAEGKGACNVSLLRGRRTGNGLYVISP